MQVSVHKPDGSGPQPVDAETASAGRDLRTLRKRLNAVGKTVPATAAVELGSQLLRKLVQLPPDTERPLELRPSTLTLSEQGQVVFDPTGMKRNRGRREVYAAPETLMGKPSGPAAEVYATCAIVLELISGVPVGRSPMLRAPHQQAIEEALADARPYLPDLAAGIFLNIFRRGLAHDAADRPRPREMAAMLDLLLVGLAGPSLPTFTRALPPVDG